MTRPLPVLLGLTVAAPLLLGLGGCSSDPYETYCERVEEHQAALGEAVAAGGPDALLDVLPELRDLRDAAPSDIADEWQQVVGRLEALQRANVQIAAGKKQGGLGGKMTELGGSLKAALDGMKEAGVALA